MTLIEVRVSLKVDADRCNPEVRAWIDLSPEDGFGSELELPLRRRGRPEWVGAFVLGETQPEHFMYRVGLVAHPCAEFWLTVRHRDLGRDLLIDGDTLAAAKSWLVGTCPLPAEGSSSETAAANATLLKIPRPSIDSRPAQRRSHASVVVLDSYRQRR